MFYLNLLIISSLLAVIMVERLLCLKKHDDVLFRFCETRRKIMKILRDRGFELPKEDYLVLRDLLDAVNMTIHNYDYCKTSVLNFRKLKKRASELKKEDEAVKRLDDVKDKEIRQVIKSFRWAMICAFFAYTPLIKSSFIIYLLARILKGLSFAGLEGLRQAASFLFWLNGEVVSLHQQPNHIEA